MKILHLAVDEKFIDMGVNSFERVWPGCNEVLVYSNSNKLKVKYCNAFKVSFIDLFNPKYINKIRNADVLVLHSLLPIFYPILLFSKKETPLVWIGWGRDYYDYLCKESELTLPVTKRKIKSLKGERNTINKIREFFFLLMKSSLLKRITHFAPVLKEEYRGELTKYKYLDWNYGTIEKDFVPNKNIKISGNKILLGNSSTIENNHIDALVKLTGSNLQRDIIMPMSYGSKSYCEVVKKYISDNNLSNINLVEEFLEYDEYIELISSCDTVFMNHIRQQALGNIIFNIYIGMRVFLREECPTYEFLTKNKIKVFSINKFELEPDEFYKVLSDEDKLKNRINILKVWGVEIIDNKTKNFIEKIL